MSRNNEQGFTLVECVIAMVIVMIGFTGICGLLTSCVKAEVMSNNLATANSLARAKMEELTVSTRTAGGSLTSSVSGYSDAPTTQFTRRWTIAADIASTQTITVAVLETNQADAIPQVQVTTRIQQ